MCQCRRETGGTIRLSRRTRHHSSLEEAAEYCRASEAEKVPTLMLPGRRHRRCSLRQEILFGAGWAIVKRPAMHDRQFRAKVAVAGRARRFPLERCGLPRVVLRRAF